MKCKIPEIAYHNKDPVLSVDFQPGTSQPQRLASGGADTHVVIWQCVVGEDTQHPDLDCLCDLTRHQRAVNIVRWSPDGALLASGDDESVIILWQQREMEGGGGGGDLFGEDAPVENRENWVVYKMIRSHLDDVYDLSWSPCSQFLLSGSVDNSAIITNVHKNQKISHLSDAKSFVQGVAWNPKHNLLATHSSDRSCRVYNSTTKKLISKTYKSSMMMNLPNQGKPKKKPSAVATAAATDGEKPTGDQQQPTEDPPASAAEEDRTIRLFHDDTFKGFFRRLTWSPDGELLLAPCGVIESEMQAKVTHCTYVFSRADFSRPVLCLPSKDKYTIAVRCCPVLFQLRPLPRKKTTQRSQDNVPAWEKYSTLFALPYRVVFAVATQNAVMLYDTQQVAPFGRVSNIHYTGLTDLSWSSDGRVLVVSSSDGFCSIITFDDGELGPVYVPPEESKEENGLSATAATASEALGLSPVLAAGESPMLARGGDLAPGCVDEEGVSSPAQIHIKSNKEGGKSNPKRLQFITLSSPKANKKLISKNKVVEKCDPSEEGAEALGVELMDTGGDVGELSLVLEETEMEVVKTQEPAKKSHKEGKETKGKKRVPLVTLSNGGGANKQSSSASGVPVATPEKNKGRRIQLITLSSPKGKVPKS